MKTTIIVILFAMSEFLFCAFTSQNQEKDTKVFLVCTLYRRHETTPVYKHNALSKIITSIKPDVFVIDATPNEWKARKVHESKQEYMQVIFPYIDNGTYKVYPAEPDEPLFTEIVERTIKNVENAKKENRVAYDRFRDYESALYKALSDLWKSPADIYKTFTIQALLGKLEMENRLYGSEFENDSKFWNRHFAEVAHKASKENPGKKIIVLVGIENYPEVKKHLEKQRGIYLVDMPKWLEENIE